MKECKKCLLPKNEADFYKKSASQGGGLRSICKQCHATQTADARKKNPEKYRAHTREWHKRHQDRIRELERSPEVRAYRARYKAENSDKIREQNAAYYQAKKGEIDARNVSWVKQNLPKSKVIHDRWKAKNPEKVSAYDRAKRAKRLAAPGSHTAEEALTILESQGYQCANPCCRVDLRAVVKHLDHKETLSKGGSDNADNLQWLCRPCNVSKHAKPYAEWLTSVTEREAA